MLTRLRTGKVLRGSTRPAGAARTTSSRSRESTAPKTGSLPRGLRRAFKGRVVVEDVSLALRRGEAVGLLGPNGAGKTTVFYMITGLIRPDAGSDRARRPRHHAPADVPARPPRHRLPAAGGVDLPRPHGGGQHPRRPGDRRAGPAQARSTISTRCSTSSTSRICASRRRSRSPAASGGAARSPARWPAGRPSCCSTSLSPASTRSRSATSRRWSAT